MKQSFSYIYHTSREYWNTRYNDIHVPLALEYALQLLLAYPDADDGVVVPAILMHDNGWKMITPEEQAAAFGPNMKRPDLQRKHELEGMKIAESILTSMDYDAQKTAAIIAIIDGHDTRLDARSLNDQLVKDADKLWRFAPTGLEIDHRRFMRDAQAHAIWTRGQIDRWFFTDYAKQLALQLVNLTIVE